jgi:hypothetical protein
MSNPSDTVFLWAEVVKELGQSLLVDTADGTRLIPVSQVRPGSEVSGPGDEGILAIPRWLADDRGLDYDEAP